MKRAALLLLVLVLGCAAACSDGARSADADGFVMNTAFSARYYGSDRAAVNDLQSTLSAVEDHISWSIDSSPLAKINATGSGSDSFVAAILNRVQPLCGMTGGELSVLMRPLAAMWNVTGDSPRVPSPDEIAAVLPLCSGSAAVSGDSIQLPSGASLDFGAFGKGYACDAALADVSGRNLSGAIVSVGGSILTYGQKPGDSRWSVSVATPDDVNNSLGLLSVDGTAFISTSGSYERYFLQDGRRYHHILSPKSGYPAESGLVSVTVLVDGSEPLGGTLCDALSTACFLVGYERSLALLDEYGAAAVFVAADRRVATYGLNKDEFTLKNNDFSIAEALS